MGKRLLYSLFLNLVASVPIFGFIYEVKIMRKWDESRKKYHYFIGLSDFHDKFLPINKAHADQIEKMLRAINKDGAKVLIEDLSTANSNGRQTCGRFSINSRGGVLGGLAETVKSMGLETDNVEFRYCRVTALGPVLNHINDDLEKHLSVSETPLAVLAKEINDVIEEISHYDDGAILKQQYENDIKEIIKNVKKLHLDHPTNSTVAQYLKQHSMPKNRMDLLKLLLTFDSALLDLKMVHSVINSPSKSKVVAIAGGAHITRTCELLSKVGYEPVKATEIAYMKEHDLDKCLGCTVVKGTFCVKPQPINIDFVDAIIKAE